MNLLQVATRILRRSGRRVSSLLRRPAPSYDPARFWKDRHLRYGFDIRGVGNVDLSVEENQRMYSEAKATLLSHWEHEAVDCARVSMLDVGCGQGFYADAFWERGGLQYCGIDITDVLFPSLEMRHPGYRFRILDVCREDIPGTFDVVLMIDVTQHIVDEDLFVYAMRNVRSHLAAGGVFFVTSGLSPERVRRGLHVVDRPLNAYREAFPGYDFGEPVAFRDKFLLTVRDRPGT